MKSGIELISEERKRQIDIEGWTTSHDAHHVKGELAIAAACYATPIDEREVSLINSIPKSWPWHQSWWKPTPEDRIKELAKAGALIAAEIDRINAISESKSEDNGSE